MSNRPVKENYRKSGKKLARLNQKRTEAQARNSAWQTLSPREQIASLDSRKVIAKKQRQRIPVNAN
jgi:hypothetical protein